MASKFDGCALHAQAYTQKRKTAGSGEAYRFYFAFPTPDPKARGDQDGVQALQRIGDGTFL